MLRHIKKKHPNTSATRPMKLSLRTDTVAKQQQLSFLFAASLAMDGRSHSTGFRCLSIIEGERDGLKMFLEVLNFSPPTHHTVSSMQEQMFHTWKDEVLPCTAHCVLGKSEIAFCAPHRSYF